MITALVLYALLVGALVALGTLVLDRAALAARLPRRFTWLGGLALLAALTLSAPWRLSPPPPAATVTPIAAAVDVAGIDAIASTPSPLRALLDLPTTLGRRLSAVAAQAPRGLDQTLGAAWAASALAALVLLALLLRRLDAQRRAWPRARLLGTPVRVGEREGPAVYGLFAPDIVIPRALLARGTEEQALVLAHEDEHRRVRDPLLLAAAAALVALLPWHPVAWWCLSRLRLATEFDCDARVLRRGVSPRRYGDVLLSLATSLPVGPRAAHVLALIDAPRHLERRLLAMTTPRTRRAPLVVSALALAGVALVVAACSTDVPTAAEVRDADVAAVTKTLGLPTGPNAVRYIVDGAPMSEVEARGIAAVEIASIEVARATLERPTSEIIIRTRAAAVARGEIVEVPIEGTTEPKKLAYTVERANTSELARDRIVRATADSIALRGDSILLAGNARVMLRRNGTPGDTVLEFETRRPYLVEGRPGGEPTLIVRGTNAERDAAAQPLLIIDGVIATVPNALQNVHPQQIDIIEVVKGEAAKRLWGERGANGVIKITTKR